MASVADGAGPLRRAAVPVGAAAAALLLFGGLGSFGLWEPAELVARDALARPAGVEDRIVAAIARALGGGELALRATGALSALAALLLVWRAGHALVSPRGGLLSALALVGMPLFLLSARQLTGPTLATPALALALFGLGQFAFGRTRRFAWRDLAVGAAGVAAGWATAGALAGAVVPLLSVSAASLVIHGPRLAPAATARTSRLAVMVLGVSGVILALGLVHAHTAGVHSAFWGGVPRPEPPAQGFEHLVRRLGFGMFPLGALAAVAVARGLVLGEGDRPPDERRAGVTVFLLLFVTLALAAGTVRSHVVGHAQFVALAAIALAVGAFLDEAGSERAPLVAVLIAIGTLVIARDLHLAPEEALSVHLQEKIRWPVAVRTGPIPLIAGGLFAVGVAALLGGGHAWGRWVALGAAVAWSALLAHAAVPTLSRHFSVKAMIDAYRTAARGGEPLALYRVHGRGPAAALAGREAPLLSTEAEVVTHLRTAGRAFALVAAEAAAPLDALLTAANIRYAVLEASSQYLLLANGLAAGERDRNPLRADVFMPRAPADRPPWPPPRVARTTVFADSVELLGADLPAEVRRPGKLALALHFRVRRRPPAGHGVFVHLELPGEALVNGDHQPVGGAFPTAFWLPDEHIRDRHEIELPLFTAPAGRYEVYVGLWPGGNRPGIPITAGENDGRNRAPLGQVVVR